MGNCMCFAAATSSSSPKENGGGGVRVDVGSGGGGVRVDVGSGSGVVRVDAGIGASNAPTLRVFSLAELRAATHEFNRGLVVGRGGFGDVYKARLGDGLVVAVKKLNAESKQGLREWQTEVDLLGNMENQNLVKLIGHCQEEEELLLVYEFMAQGSLENHLFRMRGEPLSWRSRITIALGAARGLEFLHSRGVIYRDFKAANILLDGNFHAKLSDFGLARSGPAAGCSHVTTRRVGTHGYAAPEYLATGHLYIKSDVYSFGVVLLELLTGLRTYDHNRASDKINLVPWAEPYIAGAGKNVTRVMDSRLAGKYSLRSARRVAKIATMCLCHDLTQRPGMDEVISKLEEVEAILI